MGVPPPYNVGVGSPPGSPIRLGPASGTVSAKKYCHWQFAPLSRLTQKPFWKKGERLKLQKLQ